MSCFCGIKKINDSKICPCNIHYVCSYCHMCYQCDHHAVYSKTHHQWYWFHVDGTRTRAETIDGGQAYL